MVPNTIVCISRRPLDPILLDLEEDTAAFFKLLMGIQDKKGLKKYIIYVQEKAYQACFQPD